MIRRLYIQDIARAFVVSAVTLGALLVVRPEKAWSDEARCRVDFMRTMQIWDGFGVSIRDAHQTRNDAVRSQAAAAIDQLTDDERCAIFDLIFGQDGLQPSLLELYLDPNHEGRSAADNDNDDPNVLAQKRYDHKSHTAFARAFAQEGLARTRARGDEIMVHTSLLAPPGWMTRQRFLRGRDLDPTYKYELAEYLIAWVRFLRDEERLPVQSLALHVGGEDLALWPIDGESAGPLRLAHNLYWPPAQVADFLAFMAPMLEKQGLSDLRLAPGETASWARFLSYGYAWSIQDNPDAIKNIGLITSQDVSSDGGQAAQGIELLRLKRPELHAWTTALGAEASDAALISAVRHEIYDLQVNGILAAEAFAVEVEGASAPRALVTMDTGGVVKTQPGYAYFKHLARAARPGMAVAEATSSDAAVQLLAFAKNGTRHDDTLIAVNLSDEVRDLSIEVRGARKESFAACESGPRVAWRDLGTLVPRRGRIEISLAPRSIATLRAQETSAAASGGARGSTRQR